MKNVIVECTGDEAYLMCGTTKDGKHFIADASNLNVKIISAGPEKIEIEELQDPDWQEKHFVEDLLPYEAFNYMKRAINWILINKPEGDYSLSDMDTLLDVVNIFSILQDMAIKYKDSRKAFSAVTGCKLEVM